MKIKILIFIFFLNNFCFSVSDYKVNIFIHGTRFSKLFIKYTHQINKIINIQEIPTSCITHSISEVLSKSDPENFSKDSFYVFGWSGKLSHQERVKSAKIFYDEIIRLRESLKKENIYPSINVITHSHGGNVALNLANYLEDNNKVEFKIDNLILLACPVQSLTQHLTDNEIFENVYNIYSTLDLTQILDPQGLHPENKNKKIPFFSLRTFPTNQKLKQSRIRIDNFGIPHMGFISSKFLKHLPKILEKMKIQNNLTLINIESKK